MLTHQYTCVCLCYEEKEKESLFFFFWPPPFFLYHVEWGVNVLIHCRLNAFVPFSFSLFLTPSIVPELLIAFFLCRFFFLFTFSLLTRCCYAIFCLISDFARPHHTHFGLLRAGGRTGKRELKREQERKDGAKGLNNEAVVRRGYGLKQRCPCISVIGAS